MKKTGKMNDRISTPVLGAIVGFISWETLENVAYSVLLAFLSGIAAWAGKKVALKFEAWLKKATSEEETD